MGRPSHRLPRRSAGGAILVALAVACGGNVADDTCESVLAGCRRDPSPTSDALLLCNDAITDPDCGALARAYLDCYATAVACDFDQLTDQGSTEAAVDADCESQATTYIACHGSDIYDPAPPCGGTGEACCTDGSPPCVAIGCCDPATRTCVANGATCAGSPEAVCFDGTCEACGAAPGPCCTGDVCPSGCCIDPGFPPSYCVAVRADCTSGLESPQVCTAADTCAPCGMSGAPCCEDSQCMTSTCDDAGMCP